MTKASGARVERTRTFTGCRTCRSRHAKCDEAQPECGTCRRLGLTCGGYGGRLFWITENSALRPEQQQSHRGSEYRYPLFSEVQRRLMSNELCESLGRQTAVDLLADIDLACERLENAGKGVSGMLRGPFGAFHAQDEQPSGSPDSSTSNATAIPVDPSLSACSEPEGLIEEIHRQDWAEQINESNFDLFVNSLDPALGLDSHDDSSPGHLLISDHSMANLFMEHAPAVEGLSLFSPNFVSRAIDSGAMTVSSHDDHAAQHMEMAPPAPAPSRGLPMGNSGQGLPEHAEALLRYYKQQVDGATATMQTRRKSPWQLIFLPCALETFAEISLWNGTSHTRYTILYTLLAHSAFQLHLSNKQASFASQWQEIGARHQEKAQQHLRSALQVEMFGSKQTKYKELLMAILALAMTSLYNGSHAFRIFLLDAERLIRLRGLVNANPYKIRLLHHMYTHLRVFAESVSIVPEALNAAANSGNANSSSSSGGSSNGMPLAEHVRNFRLTEESLNIGLDPALEKSLEVGYKDIHLQIQGQWKETLYPVIYGIPEGLMTMLSQTISVANEKQRLESLARCNPKLSVDFTHHVKALETSIWSWSPASEPMGPARPPQGGAEMSGNHGGGGGGNNNNSNNNNSNTTTSGELIDHPQARCMALAIHQALVIYFYRRVYDVNAMILQDNVRKTFDHLEPCLEHMIDDQDFMASLAWPAFIAASEAVAPDLQERALKCLAVTDERGLYFTPKPAKHIVSSIWARRNESKDWTMSWPGVIQDC